MSVEYCEICDEPTGKAGRLDDSLVCANCNRVICKECQADFDEVVMCRPCTAKALGVPPERLSEILRAEREGRCVVLAPGYTKCMVCKQSRNGWCENKENDGHCLFVVFNPKPTRAEAEAELSGEGAGS